MPFYKLGNLNSILGNLNEEQILNIFKQFLNFLEYLHSKNIFYNNLKFENILIYKNYEIIIRDFGWITSNEDEMWNEKMEIQRMGYLLYILIRGKYNFDEVSIKGNINDIKNVNKSIFNEITKMISNNYSSIKEISYSFF